MNSTALIQTFKQKQMKENAYSNSKEGGVRWRVPELGDGDFKL